MARFVHTSDWQLGMTRHFLGPDAQPRFTAARLDAIRRIGVIAGQKKCDFVVVCGDVFESNSVDRRIVVRSLEAMSAIPVPVLLLPANHDPLDAGSVYKSPTFERNRPGNVSVLSSTEPTTIAGVEIVPAPWFTRRPLTDLVGAACSELPGPSELPRVVVGHGAVDRLSPDPDDPAVIRLEVLESAIRSGTVRYVALGDRHSRTPVGDSQRIWYSGTPEPTDYDEIDPGHVLVVDLSGDGCSVEPHQVGTWSFVRERFDVNGPDDIDTLEQFLAACPDKDKAVLKVSLVGTLSLRSAARLDDVLEHARDLFAALETWERHSDLAVLPDDDDLGRLDLSGFALDAFEELHDKARGEGNEAEAARDALALLFRLAGGAP